MKFKRLVSKVLVAGIFISNTGLSSLASTLSEDARYETFEGNSIKIDDILEEGTVDVEIEGNTLVNLLGSQGRELVLQTNRDDDEGRVRIRSFKGLNLKTNTTYSFITNISNLSDSDTSRLKVYYHYTDENGNAISVYPEGYYSKEKLMEGKIIITFTTDERKPNSVLKLYIDSVGSTSSGGSATEFTFETSECMLLEGDWSNKEIPEYFEGIKSVGEQNNGASSIKLISENKNLFKNELYPRVNGVKTEINENGDIRIYNTTSSKWGYQYFTFDAKPNTTYTFSVDNIIVNSGVANIAIREARNGTLYGEEKYYAEFKKAGKVTFTTSDYIGKDNIKVAFSLYSSLDEAIMGDVIYKGIEIKESLVKSNYAKYFNNNVVINLKEPLRGLPNGVKDKIIKKNGQWFVERNCAEVTLTEESIMKVGNSYEDNIGRIELNIDFFKGIKVGDYWINTMTPEAIFEAIPWKNHSDNRNNVWTWFHSVRKNFHIACPKGTTLEEVKEKLLNTKVVYRLETPIYEPLSISPVINLYEEITYISNGSIIPANMRVVIDRVANRAKEFSEVAKLNPTSENISLARMWINLMDESTLKDQFQEDISSISDISDITLERKSATANLDVYIKSKNMLSMSLDTNSVTFDGYSGAEDMEMLRAVNISINSSLPYQLNAYMPSEISNADKSEILPIDILNIRDESEGVYRRFANTVDKVVLKDNCSNGNGLIHNIDLKLASNLAHKADVYKTVIKFEAEQK